jgi:hypothetical protein
LTQTGKEKGKEERLFVNKKSNSQAAKKKKLP